jgi:hypothetical protein
LIKLSNPNLINSIQPNQPNQQKIQPATQNSGLFYLLWVFKLHAMKYLNFKRFHRLFLITGIVCCCAIYVNAQTAPPKPKAKTTPAKAPKPKLAALTPLDDTTKKGAAAAVPAVAALPKTASGIVDAFFKKYREEGTSAAVDYLFGTNKYFTNTAGIAQLKAKLDSLRQGIGMYLGKDLISQKNASNSLYFYSYLVKHEVQPLRFTFIFYKPQNDWVLYRFKYDDQMDIELEDAGKINNKHQ